LRDGGGRFSWYETVLAFLDRYVLDAEWKRPALL